MTADRRGFWDEYWADQDYDRRKREHDLNHNSDVDECEFCKLEMDERLEADEK